MRSGARLLLGCLVWLSLSIAGYAQATRPAGIPPFFTYGGLLLDNAGKPLTGVVDVTFSLYADQQGGAPLWIDTQNVQLDNAGRYSIVLGAVGKSLPLDLFSAGQPRWLGVSSPTTREAEEPRVLLVSVPYALKAGDADTLGGKPVSAFLLSDGIEVSKGAASKAPGNEVSVSAVSGTGTSNSLPKWLDGIGTLGDSVMTEASGNIGIGITPASKLDVNGVITNRAKNWSISNQPGFILEENDFLDANRWIDVEGGVLRILKTNDAYTAFDTQMTIDATGKVGIGITPTSKLDVDGIITNRAKNWSISNQPGFILEENDFLDANRWIDVENGVFRILRANDAYTTFTSELVIDTAGRVGIGTASPTQALDVNGTVKATTFSGSGALLTNLSASDVICITACVGTAEIIDSAVTTAKIADSAVTTAKVADSAVTTVKVADSSITSAKIADAAITNADINSAAAIDASKLATTARTKGINYLVGCDTCTVLADTDDQLAFYYNNVGSMTFLSVVCFADAGSPVINIQRDNGATTNILSSNLTCNGIATASFAVPTLAKGEKLNFVLVDTALSNAKRLTVAIETLLN